LVPVWQANDVHRCDLRLVSQIEIIYFIELTVVVPHMFSGETEEGLFLFIPGSFMTGLNALAYCFISLATLFASPAFRGGKQQRWIRWAFIAKWCANACDSVGASFSSVIDCRCPMVGDFPTSLSQQSWQLCYSDEPSWKPHSLILCSYACKPLTAILLHWWPNSYC